MLSILKEMFLTQIRIEPKIFTIQQLMFEAKKNEVANVLKEVKLLCKEFGFTAGMLKGSLAKGRGEK